MFDEDYYPLCRTGNEKCLSEKSKNNYQLCSDSSTTTVNSTSVTTKTNFLTTNFSNDRYIIQPLILLL